MYETHITTLHQRYTMNLVTSHFWQKARIAFITLVPQFHYTFTIIDQIQTNWFSLLSNKTYGVSHLVESTNQFFYVVWCSKQKEIDELANKLWKYTPCFKALFITDFSWTFFFKSIIKPYLKRVFTRPPTLCIGEK